MKTINRKYFRIIENEKKYDTPLLSGSTSKLVVDNTFLIERQNVLIKQDFLYEDNSAGNHLEFTFPIEGKVDFEINNKYMHSKADIDMFSLSAFEHKSTSIFTKIGERIKHLSINLNS